MTSRKRIGGELIIPANEFLVRKKGYKGRIFDRSPVIKAAADGDLDAQAKVDMIEGIEARADRDKS